MNKIKIDFIAELLSHKTINLSDKERLFALSLNELKKIVDSDDEIRKEIDGIKKIIYSNSINENIVNTDTAQQPLRFNGVFCGKEMTIIADGETANTMPLCKPSTKEILLELACRVFYEDDIITARIIVDDSFDKDNKNTIEILEKKITEALQRELAKYLKGTVPSLAHVSPKQNEASLSGTQTSKDTSREVLPILHNPAELVLLLKNFSINNSPLKYTTHSWDAGRDAKMFKDTADFLALAAEQYKSFSFYLKSLSENLNGKIYNFLFNREISKKGWGMYRIRFGWSSPELVDECTRNPNLNPEDMILPAIYQMQISGKTIQKFKHVIDVFKNEIEIRDENSALLNLILEKHDKFLVGFSDPIIENLDNKTFYTDVQWLSKALDLIFENIQNRPQHTQVIYSINETNDDFIVLEIIHVNSFNTGKSIYDEKLQLLKGSFGDICKYLKNLCDWSIESQFAEGFYRINYLTSDFEAKPQKKLETAIGFKHILTFYK